MPACARPRVALPTRARQWPRSSSISKGCSSSGTTSSAARCASGCRRPICTLCCAYRISRARAARSVLDAEGAPEFGGLSADARRAINLAAGAYAQSLWDRLAPTGLVEPARVAAGRREPPRDDYGDRAGCEAMMAEIQRARGLLEQRGSLSQEIKQRSERLGELAKSGNEGGTVPVAENLSPAVDGSKALNDDMWETYHTLLR